MAKSSKAVILHRIDEVVRLLLAGAEFPDIWQYASQQSWEISKRQAHRYVEAAYQRLANAAHRDREQLLGRHLMQRRALYARAIKANDIRTALQVLRDEAALEGLYPPAKIAPTSPDGEHAYHSHVMAELMRLAGAHKERPDVIDGAILDQTLLQESAADDDESQSDVST